MNTAQPASLPPGVCGSGGISRSTSASMAAPSSAVKYTQGPGRTALGGLPAFGAQGKLSFTTPAKTGVAVSNVIAVVNSRSRRRMPEWNCDGRDLSLKAPSAALSSILSVIIGLPHIRNAYDVLRHDAQRPRRACPPLRAAARPLAVSPCRRRFASGQHTIQSETELYL